MAIVILYISENKFEVVNTKTGKTASGSEPFSTNRLLVGDQPLAEKLLSGLLSKVVRFMRPKLIIQPLEKVEGGLSYVEEVSIIKMAFNGGARAVKMHLGEKLPIDIFQTVQGRSLIENGFFNNAVSYIENKFMKRI